MTIIEESAITYKMTESFLVCAESMAEASREYHTVVGSHDYWLTRKQIERFKAQPVGKEAVVSKLEEILASKFEASDRDEEEKRD